jgi:hypothetical protein
MVLLLRDREFTRRLSSPSTRASRTLTATAALDRLRLPDPRPVSGIVFDGNESASWNSSHILAQI